MTALFTPSMPMASAPEWRTWAFSSSSTEAPCSAAEIAAMVPAVPPPTTATSQSSTWRSASGGTCIGWATSLLVENRGDVRHRSRYGMFTVTAPVGQRAAHGPQYQHSSTCMYALPLPGLMASESSGQMSTHSVQPSMHKDASMVTGTSALFSTRGMREIYFSDQKSGIPEDSRRPPGSREPA